VIFAKGSWMLRKRPWKSIWERVESQLSGRKVAIFVRPSGPWKPSNATPIETGDVVLVRQPYRRIYHPKRIKVLFIPRNFKIVRLELSTTVTI
jgi:hypothetical protein